MTSQSSARSKKQAPATSAVAKSNPEPPRMSRHHIKVDENLHKDWMTQFASRLAELGFVPLLSDAQDSIRSGLSLFGMQAPRLLGLTSDLYEFLIHHDEQSGIFIKRSDPEWARRVGRNPSKIEAVDILLVTGSGSGLGERVQPIVRDVFNCELSHHSWKEEQLIDQLTRKLGELSPNGRLLGDQEIKKACSRLGDDNLRSAVSSMVSAFGDSSAPRSAMERLEPFVSAPRTLDKLLLDDEIVASQFAIYCPRCDISSLLFQGKQKAEAAIVDAGGKCGNCRAAIEVQQTFQIARPYFRGLQQGIWLESFISDLMSSYSDAVWTGQMIEGDEVDVVSVAYDRTFLVECKDTSFGQSDLYVSSVKARNVGADVVIIVSTRDVHPNVSGAMQRMKQGNVPRITVRSSEERTFHLVSCPNVVGISEKLHQFMGDIARRTLSDWAMVDPMSIYF